MGNGCCDAYKRTGIPLVGDTVSLTSIRKIYSKKRVWAAQPERVNFSRPFGTGNSRRAADPTLKPLGYSHDVPSGPQDGRVVWVG